MQSKPALRKYALSVREAMGENARHAASSTVAEALTELIRSTKATRVAVFYPMRGEIDVRALGKHATLYFPKIIGGRIAFFEDTGELEKGPFGTTVPAHDNETKLSAIDMVVVPGLCYDRRGYRIGYGKGYYDELLSRYQGFSVGVCFADLVVDELPIEPHDRAVSMLVTERGTMKG